MPKPKNPVTPETRMAFDSALGRIKSISGCSTQMQLAEFIGVRQSSISDAKRRCSVPAEWLLTIQRKTGINPGWILCGDTEPRYMVASHEPGRPVDVKALREQLEAEVRDELDNLHAEDCIRRLQEMGLAVQVTPQEQHESVPNSGQQDAARQ